MSLFFFPMYVSRTGTLENVQILSLAFLHSPNIKINSAPSEPSVSLFKVPNDESLAVYAHSHFNYGKKQSPFVCKQTRGLPDLGVYHVIILAGIISYINYFIFTFDFYLSFFTYFFKHKNDK